MERAILWILSILSNTPVCLRGARLWRGHAALWLLWPSPLNRYGLALLQRRGVASIRKNAVVSRGPAFVQAVVTIGHCDVGGAGDQSPVVSPARDSTV